MVLFTLTGLNVDVGLYEFIEYPTYDFPDISASYYLDLSFNPIYFDNIFYFKTTNPDMLDITNFGTNISKNNIGNLSNYVAMSNNGPLEIDANYDFEFRWKYNVPTNVVGGDDIRFIDAGIYNIDDHNNFVIKRRVSNNKFYIRLNIVGRTGESEIVHGMSGTLIGDADNIVRNEDNYLIMKYSKIKNKIIIANANHSNWLAGGINDDARWNSILETHAVARYDANISSVTSIRFNSPGAFGGGHSDMPDNVTMYFSFINIPPLGFDGDMNFKCESSYWPDISFSEGVISNNVRTDINNYLPPSSANGVQYNKNIGVQWLTRNITGGYNNSDLFANEEALVQQYVTLDGPSQTGTTTLYGRAIRNSYKYYRIIFPSINTDPTLGIHNDWDHLVAISYIKVYNKENISNINTLQASSTYRDGQQAQGTQWSLNTLTSYDIVKANAWLSEYSNGVYDDNTGVYNSPSPSTTHTTDLTIAGEWIQWQHDHEIIISKFVLYTGGGAGTDTGAPPGRIVLVGRNNENDNWNIIYDKTYPFGLAEYSIIFEDSIKTLITSTLDDSGGSDAAPLSNADTNINNVSREALLHLLDGNQNEIQRVHNMIAKSHTNVDSDGNHISFGDTSNLWIPIEFFDGDTIKFKLIYKPDQITDSSGVAIDDSGNALGTNKIEDQDYVVRLNILGNRSDLFLRSSFLSNDISVNNYNFNNSNNTHQLLDNVSNRNSNYTTGNYSTIHNDPTFGTYVKVGRQMIGETNITDICFNTYSWDFRVFRGNAGNWTHGSLYNNSIFLTWVFRLHPGGYNKSIASQDISPPSFLTEWKGYPLNVDLTNDRMTLYFENYSTNYNINTNVLLNPQQFAVFFSKQFADVNSNCTFGFFNGKYYYFSGYAENAAAKPEGADGPPVSSSMTSETETNWRVLTLAVGPHSEYANDHEVSIFENGILLGKTGKRFCSQFNTSNTDTTHSGNDPKIAFDINSSDTGPTNGNNQGVDFLMGAIQGEKAGAKPALPSIRRQFPNNYDNPQLEGDIDGDYRDRNFSNTLPYDLALWELHESTATGFDINFTAKQIYGDYVNKYKYDFVNGVSIA